jgi:hypothetical protein
MMVINHKPVGVLDPAVVMRMTVRRFPITITMLMIMVFTM